MSEIMDLMKIPEIVNAGKVICIQPHPDDNEIGMGGTIALLAEKGCDIYYLTVTDGSLGTEDTQMKKENLRQMRHKEAIEAGTVLGAKHFEFMDKEDGSLSDIPVLAKEIAQVIRTIQPDMIFCPDPWSEYEAHYDHIVTGRAAAQAAISSNLAKYPEGTDPWQVEAIGFYFTNKPNQIVDVSNTFDQKFMAMKAHKTQMPDELLELYRQYFKMQSLRLAEEKSFDLGEGLRVMRPLHLHCFVEALMI
ncbi:MAG: PIG-L family deacetylase [Lachnospiraceae bacterium]|nr:PIG-L family deacetylase [Lachnospiraceae bacterium]